MIALRAGQASVVKYLLDYAADINIREYVMALVLHHSFTLHFIL